MLREMLLHSQESAARDCANSNRIDDRREKFLVQNLDIADSYRWRLQVGQFLKSSPGCATGSFALIATDELVPVTDFAKLEKLRREKVAIEALVAAPGKRSIAQEFE